MLQQVSGNLVPDKANHSRVIRQPFFDLPTRFPCHLTSRTTFVSLRHVMIFPCYATSIFRYVLNCLFCRIKNLPTLPHPHCCVNHLICRLAVPNLYRFGLQLPEGIQSTFFCVSHKFYSVFTVIFDSSTLPPSHTARSTPNFLLPSGQRSFNVYLITHSKSTIHFTAPIFYL